MNLVLLCVSVLSKYDMRYHTFSVKLGAPRKRLRCISGEHLHPFLAFCGVFDTFVFIISPTVVILVKWS